MKVLRFKLDMPPMANKETQITRKGIAYTPTAKRDYMKRCARKLRKYKGEFAGIKFIQASFVFVCDRPKKAPDGIPADMWKKMINFYKPTRPDSDNFLKPLQDSMSHHVIQTKKTKYLHTVIKGAKIIDDDSFLVSTKVEKVYRRLDQEPHILVKLKEINYIYEYPNNI
jgi:Holliday junction resolvase RusA-like endonuclease